MAWEEVGCITNRLGGMGRGGSGGEVKTFRNGERMNICFVADHLTRRVRLCASKETGLDRRTEDVMDFRNNEAVIGRDGLE